MDWIINEGMSQVKSSVMDTRNIDGDVRKLRTSLLTTNVLMDKAEWWRFKDENVDKLLTELVDARYDAKDLLEEFDYQKIKDGEGSSRASQILSSISNFSISNFAKGIISRMPNRVRDIQGRLDDAALKLENAIGILGSEYGPEHVKSVSRETSSLISEIKVFGRDEERNKVIEILLRSGTEIGLNSGSKGKNVAECSNKRRMRNNLSVLPIVGMGGVGKTTLAQLVYNDERVNRHFYLICWVCVSHNYDEKRIINEILESIRSKEKGNLESNHGRTQSHFPSLTTLQENLRNSLMSKRFLIILDDVWNESRRDWQSLFAPLRDGCEGSVILVTTRSSEVAEIMGTVTPISLEGLTDDIFWVFFKSCAFGSTSPESHPELVEIGKKISTKLKGSPLAAKTVGGLLSVELDVKHWNTILGSEISKLQQRELDIMPALRLSYLYLPAYLKRCFAFCSMFPKNYQFRQDRLVCMWVVNGLVSPHEGMLLEEIGDRYLNDLVRRSFLQSYPDRYENLCLHDLMHDLAQSVSSSECLHIQLSDQIGKLSETIRHLSVFCKMDELLEIRNMHKMHSLALGQFHRAFDRFPIPDSWLRDINKMTRLHMLMLSSCNIKEVPQSIGDLKHLGYLDLRHNPITELPESICQIYSLQFLSIWDCPIRNLPEKFSKLIKLKILDADNKIISRIPEIRKLTSLQRLYKFKISKENGREIMELKEMNQLRNRLNIKNLENVEDEETAAQANLINKKYLSHLSLEWSSNRSIYRSNNNACQKDEKVLGFLQLHKNLKILTLRSYLGAKLPYWLMTKWLPCLVGLQIFYCSAIKELTVFPSSLGRLNISGCTSLESLECLSPQNLPVIKIISIVNCDKLESLPVEKLSGFSFLEELIISYCPKLICSQKLMLPSSLKTLALKACCGINCSLPDSLFNVASLTKLEITHCPHRTSLLWYPIIKLDELIFSDCEELEWLERLGDPLRLKKLSIIRCPKLRVNEMLTPECGENGTIALQLSELAVSDISILRSPVLRNAIPCIKKLTIDGSNVVKLLTPECGENGTIALQLSELAVSDISILRSPVLRNTIQCIKKLTIYGSNVVTLFTGEDNEILEQFVSLEQLIFKDCANLQLLELPNLNSLKSLEVHGSPELKLASDKGLPSLQSVGYDNHTDFLVVREFLGRNCHK